MPKTFFTSDHHFLDFREAVFQNEKLNLFLRPFQSVEEQDEIFVQNWNETVAPEDTIWYLGDFTVVKAGLEFRKRLNGKIHLIRGNKEDIFTDDELLQYFDSVQTEAQVKLSSGETVNLVHYPVLGVKDMFNLVGHVHKAWTIQPNMINVGVDVWHFSPISEVEICFLIHNIRTLYDKDCFPAYLPANQDNLMRIEQFGKSYIRKNE
jgi:calcineurin-like phosphoesterase family protein